MFQKEVFKIQVNFEKVCIRQQMMDNYLACTGESEDDQEIPKSHTADQHMALREKSHNTNIKTAIMYKNGLINHSYLA